METKTEALTNDRPLKELLTAYLKRWYWFVIGLVLALGIAMIYLRYTTKLYRSQATVIVKDDKSGGAGELAAFSEMGGFFSRFQNSKIENELAIFRSKRLITEVVKKLNLNIQYQSVGAVKGTEIYRNRPFTVQYLSFKDSTRTRPAPQLLIEIQSRTQYHLESVNGTIEGTYTFGDRVSLPFGDVTLIPHYERASFFREGTNRTVSVTYLPLDQVALRYQRRVQVANELGNSNVVQLRMQSAVPEKAEDFLNELVFQYNKDAINDRSQISQKTANFIDSRLEIITRELDSVEQNKETFKSNNRLTDIEAEAQLILENASEFNKRQLDVGTQLELTSTMIEYMEGAGATDLLPANIALEESQVGEAVSNYNQLVLERNRLLKNSTSKNPVVVNVNNQLDELRNGILSSLQNTRQSLQIALRDLNTREGSLNARLSQVPSKEKIFRGIERQQSIKEQLYLFLLQQREEASISLAATSAKAKVVDAAYTGKAPVAPNSMLIYLGAGLAGLLLPFLVIYGAELLNTKVENRSDVNKVLPQIPFVGEIPKLKKGDEQLIQENDRSILAESFRILRTNLQFLLFGNKKEKQDTRTIFVTSTIKGEGKTMVAFNLALTIALTGKKVALVGADIRNPQLHRYLSKSDAKKKGLTEYIIDPSMTVAEVTHRSTTHDNISIVLSGAIPPNPAELLMRDRTGQFFNEIKNEFDYVIVDTAPSLLVTDTILINKWADITLYVIRANYSDKKLLSFPKDALLEGKLENVALVLNNVDMTNFGYGNKYGYVYRSDAPSSFWQRFFSKN
ncbi:GumC family protein [Altibacter sp. HG106]|uniref:GumC family protein n=1 Tax=Altibacter sp. HG106 TaxID=3023937 RepID=UPI0023504C27|nr:tyrosine-protein kinase family protein [Altibacter sp. HG106]MDC7995351.1 polysaccharide biosynthesis tyrosine autokinase [Altibacter sp. HG106]